MNDQNAKLEEDRNKQKHAVFSFLIIICILLFTVAAMALMKIYKREAQVTNVGAIIPSVKIFDAEIANHQVKLRTQGVIESSRETSLAAEVSGSVLGISENLERGARVKKGDSLVEIDPANYKTALANAMVAAADADVTLAQEKVRGEQAVLDWEKLGQGKQASPLLLRKPYLKAAQSRVFSASAQVERARRDLARTKIIAPFDGVVRMANVEAGAVINPGMVVAEIYADEELEVRLPLSLRDFGFLKRNENNQVTGHAEISGTIGGKKYAWLAELVRTDPEIERKTLSANIVLKIVKAERVEFPLPPVGLFVNAEIEGKTIENTISLSRRAILEGSRIIVINAESEIDFRDVTIVRANEKTAVIESVLEDGERIVLTRLSTPVTGMKVAVENEIEEEK